MTKTKVIKIPKQKGFAEVAFVWLKEHRQLADVDFTHNAYYRKERFVYIFMNFLMERFKNYSIPFEEINEKLLNELYLYSRTELNFSIPYYRKMVQTIKQVVNYAVINDLTTKSYIFNYKIKSFAKKQILYITLAQIKELQEAEIHNEKLSRTRDFFLFQCYTGVAYIDMKTFKLSNLITDAFQNEWIVIHRQKTGGKSTIPLMPEAKAIIEKYRNVTKTVNPGGFFPIQNNKDYNDTLKKLENYSSIPRESLHSHCGRKTFAMTVLNSGNVSIETVSKMLGHAKIDMTQKHYAFVDTKKIRNEMEKFSFTPKRAINEFMDYIEEDYKKLALQFAKLFSDCTPAECKEALHNMFLGFIGSQFCGEIPDRTREYTTICYFELTKCFDAIEKLHINISTQQKLVQWLINNNQLDVFSQYIKDKKWLLN